MKQINLKQGSQEWLDHRLNFYNASDAPAMLGLSIYESRNDFLKRLAFGGKDVNKFQQKIYDKGHEYEALARPLAEKIIGEDLFPVVGISDNHPKLSASFDGLTLLENIGFEHKTLNEKIAKVQTIDDLDEQYLIQMEHQLIVSDAEKILFMATKWDGPELIDSKHFYYFSDAVRREKIITGWRDFEKDLNEYKANYKPEIIIFAKQIDDLPLLQVQVKGEVIASNINAFKDSAFIVLDGIQTTLKTDQDFADAGEVVKWCKTTEEKLKNAKTNIINQTASIAEVLAVIEQIEKKTANKRLSLSKLIEAEKEARKIEAINKYRQIINDAYLSCEKETGAQPEKMPDNFANEIKGKRNLDSINDALFSRTREILASIELQKSNVLKSIAEQKQSAIEKRLDGHTTALIEPTNTIAPIEAKNVSKVESLSLFDEAPKAKKMLYQWVIRPAVTSFDIEHFICDFYPDGDKEYIDEMLSCFLDYLQE